SASVGSRVTNPFETVPVNRVSDRHRTLQTRLAKLQALILSWRETTPERRRGIPRGPQESRFLFTGPFAGVLRWSRCRATSFRKLESLQPGGVAGETTGGRRSGGADVVRGAGFSADPPGRQIAWMSFRWLTPSANPRCP